MMIKPKIFSISFKLKKLLYVELIANFNKKFSLFLYSISQFFNKKRVFVKKLIAISFSLLTLSNTINTLAFAQELQTSKSPDISVGFGKDGKLLQAINSNYLAVGINNPAPSILSSDPGTLPPIEAEMKVKLYGGGFTEKTSFSLVNENLEPIAEPLPANISSQTQTDLTLKVPPSEIQRGKLTLLAQNKDIKDGSDLKSNLFNIPLDYAAPIVINKGGKSLVNIAPVIGVAPQIVTFDANGVVNPDDIYLTSPQELKYKWDVGENLNALENPVATYTYTKPGKYTATLTVENAYGKTSTVKKEIEIRDNNEAPNVDAAYTTNETDDYLEVSFDASMSIDPESDPISFNWDLGDGTEITDKIFTYKFTKKGTYTPKIIATDSLGATTTKYLEAITYLGPNIPSTPIANISPSIGYLSLKQDSLSLSPQLLVKLSAKDSFDKDGEIKNYKWTISDSGNENPEVKEGSEVTHEFTQAGTYKVKLAVTDNRNRTVEKEETVTVKKPDPIASADIDKTSGNAPLSVQFNSNSSRDFDGSLVNVKWNFGDGTDDSIEPNPIHTYNKPGAYLATLTVTAPDGRIKKTNTKTILVNENNGPVGIISVIEGVQTGIPNEGMIKLSAKGSYDRESNQMLSYSWSWVAQQLDKDKNLIDISEVINKEIKENTSEEFSYTFITPGQYTPTLEVKTEDGRASKINGETITIVPGQEPVAIANITSNKLQGTDSLSVTFDGSGSYDPKADGSLISYFWEFGDGQTASEITPEHTYNTPGEYNAKLTIQDNRGFKSTALARTIKVVPSLEENSLAREISEIVIPVKTGIQNTVTSAPTSGFPIKLGMTDSEKNLRLQTAEETSLLSFSSDEEKPIDNTPPQISLSISNPDVKAGETLSLSAHITDDISVETVGYKLIDENNNIVLEELESAPGNNQIDEFMANVDYTKDILIPQNTPQGKYKLLLFAKDKSDNWIGKADSNQIISSEITITGRLEETSNILVSSEDLDEKPDASVISKLDEVLQEATDEERKKLLELVASDKENDTANSNTIARKYLKEKNLSSNLKNLKARVLAPNVMVGSPPTYGAPSVMSYVTSVSPTVSSVMISQTSTPYIDVSLMTVVNSNSVKNFSSVQINVSPSTNPQIEKTITISCAAGRDCSIYNEKIKEIENPTISVTPQDSYGNPIGSTSTLQLDLEEANNVKPPVIDSLETTSRQRGLGAFNLKVTGSMFNETSFILWDGNKLETNYKDPHNLAAFVPASFTFDSKLVKIQVKKQKDGQSYLSNVLNFEVLPKASDKRFLDLNTLSRVDKEVFGNDETLLRSGGNVFIDNTATTFKDAGDITIPFVVSHESNLNLEVIGSIVSSNQNPLIHLYHNNKLVSSLVSDKAYSKDGATSTKSKNWKVNLGELPPGSHTIRLGIPDLSNKTIVVLDRFKLGFSEIIRPKVTSVSPSSIYPPNESDRTVTLTGANFGKNPKVLFNGELLSTTTITEEKKIEVKLPVDLKLEPNQKNLSLQLLNTQSNEKSDKISIGIASNLEIYSTDAVYKFNPNIPNGELKVNLKTTNNSDTTYIGVFDKEGRIVKEPYHEGKTNTPLTSFVLPYNLTSGEYHVVSLLTRKNTNANVNDYSNEEAKKLFDDLTQNKLSSDEFKIKLTQIPNSHKNTFEIGSYAVPNIKLSGVASESGNNIIQENQEISLSVDLKGNTADSSSLKLKVDFGDGIVSEHESNSILAKHIYKLPANTKNQYFNITAKVFLSSIEIGSNQIGLTVYKDLPPVAVAVIDTENYEYQGDAPVKSGFADKSYDPNDEITGFNGALDKIIPEQNIWKLFKYKDGTSNQIVNTEDLSVTGNQILSSGKSFITGNILNPGTYYANLTVFDRGGNSDSTQSETLQITLPTQKLLVHASFENPNSQAFEYDSEGKVKVNLMSNVQIRGSKQPKNIFYKWNFDDGTTSEEPNPTHTYKQSVSNKDKADYHPDLTVTAIWANGYSETWSSKAGTVSIIDKPEFVAIELLPNTTIGNVALTVTFMVTDKSFAKNATLTSYSFDYGDGSETETGTISSLDELKSKIFTHTYNTHGDFTPVLKVKIKESTDSVFEFKSPIISTNSLLVSVIEVLEPPDNYVTNQPIQTFKINTGYINPTSEENRLSVHILDENGNEIVTELDPASLSQTVSLSEGKDSYWFEMNDSSGNVIKSDKRIITCDLTNPSLQVFSPGNKEVIKNESLKIFGSSQDENLDRIEYQIDNNPPVVIIEDDLRIIENGNVVFFKEIGNLINGKHILRVRAIDKAVNITEERFNIGVGNDTFIFSRLLPLRNNFDAPVIGNNDGEEGFNIGVGSPFKIQTSVRFYGDTTGKNDSYADVTLKSNSSSNGNEPATLDKELFEVNAELLETHNVFQGGDLDGPSPNTNIIYRSSLLNQKDFTKSLFNTTNKNIASAWELGKHNIKFNVGATSPTSGVSLVNLNDPTDISAQLEQNYNIEITRPVEVLKPVLSPEITPLNNYTSYTATIKVKDFLTFNNLDRNIKLLLDQATLIKPQNSKTEVENLKVVENSYVINSNNDRLASINISFNLKPDILPSKDEKYELIIPLQLTPDSNHINGYLTKAKIEIPVQGEFPAIIENPAEGEIVTSQNITSAKLLGAANNINTFEKQNVLFALSIGEKDPIKIKANSGNEQIIRITGQNKTNEDISFEAKVPFDLFTLSDFKDLFITGEAFGPIELYSTYTNAKNNTSFNGKPKKLLLLDNPIPVIKQTTLKKDKNNIVLKLVMKNNSASDEVLVKITPYKSNEEIIGELPDSITNQLFSFINQNGTPQLTQTKRILLPLNTEKVKIEIKRNNNFLNTIKERLSLEWKENFIPKAKEEETKFRIFTISLNDTLKSDCEAINELLNSKITISQEVNALKELAGCEVEKTFFTENSQETDSIRLPFVTNGTASIPDNSTFGITGVSFPFSDQLTLKDFKQLLKDLKLLSDDNNNSYDLETQEATYELLRIIDNLRCASSEIIFNPSLRKQTINLQCGISTGNYQEYILNSIKQNLPIVLLIKELTNVLKPIGLQSPPVSSDLPDSILYRAFANEGALLPLPPWVKVALGLGVYIATAALNNQKTKLDYFEQVKDSTCTRVNGTIDRRFIIGKDLNNLDRMRTNTMAGISVDNSTFYRVNVTEPFPHIPQYPGFYSTCLPEGSHTITLQFNGQNTFSMSITVPRTSIPYMIEPFVGGVFRKHGTARAIGKVIESKRILDSGEGDIKSAINPIGAGAYLTNLNLIPNIEANTTEIAKALRLYRFGTFEPGNPNSTGELEPERANAYIDLAIDTRAIFLDTSNNFPLQFVFPNSFLDFGLSDESFHAILIDKLGESIEP